MTLLTIGIVSGLTAARDAMITELGDVAEAMLSLDQSYTIAFPLRVEVHSTSGTSSGSDSSFTDATGRFEHCSRNTDPEGIGPVADCDRDN